VGLIYLDACLLIYLIERHPLLGDKIARLVMQFGEERFGISPLVKCECLVGPIKRADLVLQRAYNALFEQFESLSMPEPVYLQAAELRARFGLRTPDALHLACAQHHRCEALWTNDDRLAGGSHGLARNVLGGPPVEGAV
jgi:predicted nucleic acid-binding protein